MDGIIHSGFREFCYGKDEGMLDVSEAPQAYKDIDEVINNQLDLIDPIVKLKPIISLKG